MHCSQQPSWSMGFDCGIHWSYHVLHHLEVSGFIGVWSGVLNIQFWCQFGQHLLSWGNGHQDVVHALNMVMFSLRQNSWVQKSRYENLSDLLFYYFPWSANVISPFFWLILGSAGLKILVRKRNSSSRGHRNGWFH